ncbi:ABC transporter ATP-binding protein [Spiroplasma endosymbiont of Anurida maritima]|uniref:ABC transporter ATP-binding protein n=1 Tax=Spiroplasma endosymbiont of Anurida maritima TaxID=2967972 RepID=UPI0036D20EA3
MTEIINLKNIDKNYGDKTIFENLNLSIQKGERIGIVGPNGAGKTTLCEIIAGVRDINKGKVTVQESEKIGFQFQETFTPAGIKPWDFINYYLTAFNINISPEKLQKMFESFGVSNFINKSFHKLSGGQKQRVNIVLSMIYDPDLLILDELGSGLDLESVQKIYDEIKVFLQPSDKTLLMISHDMDELEMFCNKILFINDGKIVSEKNVKNITNEFGSVKKYVQEQFKEYKIGAYEAENLSDKDLAKNTKWMKNLNKLNKKRVKDDK